MIVKQMRTLPLALSLLAVPVAVQAGSVAAAQTAPAATATPRQSGTIKAVTPQNLVLTTAAGQDYAVTMTPATRVLLVPPGSRDLSAAQAGSVQDIAGGDRAIVSGTAGDAGLSLTATRILVMKAGAIAASHSAEQAAWAHGTGGIVRTVDAGSGTVTLASGMRTTEVTTTPQTVVRRYASGSVRFEDAVKSSLGEVHPGDQMRVRGQRSADGNSVAADEIVAGSFSNFSGVLTAVDASAGTVTLKDLATKRTVTVAVEPQSNLRRLPPGAGQGMGAHTPGVSNPAGSNPGARTAAAGGSGAVPTAGTPGGANAEAGHGPGRPGGNAGMDLSRMLTRLPTETVAELKPGDAVMIVATNSTTGAPVAITMLSGVEQILAAHPTGETTLSPWSLGGGEGGEGESGPGGGGSGGA